MTEPVRDLAALLRAVGPADYVVVGGLAVIFLAGEEMARQTRDIDIVAMTEGARDRLIAHLESAGYRVGASGGWLRAALPGVKTKSMVDIASNPVVNPKTFEELTLRGTPIAHNVDGMAVQVAAPDDLALLKLAAHRDQDVVDLMLLAGRLSARTIAANAEQDDVERTAAEGAQAARLVVSSGALGGLTEELLGRSASARESLVFETFLRELETEGL